jgi:hypothetical protein
METRKKTMPPKEKTTTKKKRKRWPGIPMTENEQQFIQAWEDYPWLDEDDFTYFGDEVINEVQKDNYPIE